jgi:hypothetical protein
MWRAMQLANFLLGDGTVSDVLESSVHRAKHGQIWIATFTGPEGGQVWRSTGLTDREQALLVARRWETEARDERLRRSRGIRKAIIRVRPSEPRTATGPFTQQEIALAMKISERAVRRLERSALQKLRRHPELRQLWQKYLAGELVEKNEVALSSDEIAALFGLTRTEEERALVRKILKVVQG